MKFASVSKKLLNKTPHCELCGNDRNREVHHIIPRVCGGTDEEDNLIVLCGSCHAKLTPRRALCKYGIDKVKRQNAMCFDFYAMLEEELNKGEVPDICDVHDAWFQKWITSKGSEI